MQDVVSLEDGLFNSAAIFEVYSMMREEVESKIQKYVADGLDAVIGTLII
jgi:hypothetical protein